MFRYRRLTREERYQIAVLLKSSRSLREIAQLLGRNASTVSRELCRDRERLGLEPRPGPYRPGEADRAAHARRAYPRKKKIVGALERRVRAGLASDWSPEQIAGQLGTASRRCRGRKPGLSVCCASIYRFVYRDAHLGGSLHAYLRTRRAAPIKRKCVQNGSLFYRAKIVNRVSHRTRPRIIERRVRIGDYERDTMRSKISQDPMLLTVVDRTSRFTKIALIERKSSVLVHHATTDLLRNQPVRSITNDNGTEFSEHEQTSAELQVPVFFTDPYCSWQRGTNENTNGLIRQYFPKTLDFRKITPEQVRAAEHRLNTRPRKCLGYRTPLEVHRSWQARVLRWM